MLVAPAAARSKYTSSTVVHRDHAGCLYLDHSRTTSSSMLIRRPPASHVSSRSAKLRRLFILAAAVLLGLTFCLQKVQMRLSGKRYPLEADSGFGAAAAAAQLEKPMNEVQDAFERIYSGRYKNAFVDPPKNSNRHSTPDRSGPTRVVILLVAVGDCQLK